MRTVLLVIVVQFVSFSVTKEVVALGTGTKCIGLNKMRKTGKHYVKSRTTCLKFLLGDVIESMKNVQGIEVSLLD